MVTQWISGSHCSVSLCISECVLILWFNYVRFSEAAPSRIALNLLFLQNFKVLFLVLFSDTYTQDM